MLVPRGSAGLHRSWRSGRPIDVPAMLGPMRRGSGDPAFRVDADGTIWRGVRPPLGPATLALRADPRNGLIAATAWGSGAPQALDMLPELLGSLDRPDGFDPRHPLLRDTWRRHAGWRVPRSGLVLEALLPAVLEQKVTGTEAWRAWRYLVRRYGDPAPGPSDRVPPELRVPPPAQVWRRIPTWEWHRAGVDSRRSGTAVRAAGAAGRLEQIVDVASHEARLRLRTISGVGEWTAAEVAQRALGDPDAVSVGDFHLPTLVGWALRGTAVDDDGMLELLEPYRGHRYRAVRMIELSGVRPPRRGPRFSPRDYRSF